MQRYLSTDPNAGRYLSTDPTAGVELAPIASGEVNAGQPPMIGGTMAMRAGVGVLAPKNPGAALDTLKDAGNVALHLPEAMIDTHVDYAKGALKGLGGMADYALHGIGLRGDDPIADVAFEPENPVQSVGKGVAQMGTGILASEAALGAMGMGPLTKLIGKLLSSPAGQGAGTTAYELAKGKDPKTAVAEGAGVAASAWLLPKAARAIIGKMFPKATAAEVAAATEEAIAARAAKAPQSAPVPSKVATPADWTPAERTARMKAAVEAGPRGAAAKAEARRVAPIPPSKSPVRPPDPKPPELEPERSGDRLSSLTAEGEAAARAARQKEHIAETYRAKAAKEAKNEADSLDLEAQLQASLKPKGKAIPAEAQDLAEKIRARVLAGKQSGLSRTQIKAGILQDVLPQSSGYRPADIQRLVDMVLKEK